MKTSTVLNRTFDVFNNIFMLIVIALMLFPFIHVFNYSLSNPLYLDIGLVLFPRGFNISSYVACFQQMDVFNSLTITIGRTVIGSFTIVLLNSMAGYVLAKDEYLGVKFFRKFIVFTMYFSGGIIPSYMLIKTLNLTNNFLVYILPLMISAFNLILIKAYVEALPKEMEESANMDGANEITIFYKIILPLCRPIIAVVILFGAIVHWNDFLSTLLYNSMNRKLYTLQFVLYNMIASQTLSVESAAMKYGVQDVSAGTLRMAVTFITMLPIIAIYPFAQKYFVSGLLVGSIKA